MRIYRTSQIVRREHKHWDINISVYNIVEGDKNEYRKEIDKMVSKLAEYSSRVEDIKEFRHIDLIVPYLASNLNVPIKVEILVYNGLDACEFLCTC